MRNCVAHVSPWVGVLVVRDMVLYELSQVDTLKHLKRPYLETTYCFEFSNSTVTQPHI